MVNILAILVVIGIPSLSVLALKLKKDKNELVYLLRKTPVQNQSLKNLAKNLELDGAYDAIKHLEQEDNGIS